MRMRSANNSIARRRAARSASAFSLIEVLAALMLVAIVLPVAMRGISMASEQASLAARRTQATMLAERQMNEILILESFETGEDSGTFEDFPQYEWQSLIEDWDDDGLMQQVDVTVIWRRGESEHSVTLTTLISAEDS